MWTPVAGRMIASTEATRKVLLLVLRRSALAGRLEGRGPDSAVGAPHLWPWFVLREPQYARALPRPHHEGGGAYFKTSLSSAAATSFFWSAGSRKPSATALRAAASTAAT